MSQSRVSWKVRLFSLLFTSALALALASCSGKPAKPQKDIHLKGAGASYPAVLYAHWFDKYDKETDGVSLEYESVGSGKGVERFLAGDSDRKVDFGASDNGIFEEEAKKVTRGVLQVPTAGGLIALVYNLPGIERLQLSRQPYADIFLGKITRWNDEAIKKTNPRAELPDRKITVIVRRDGSGTTYHFTNHLSAISTEWKAKHGAKRKIDWPGEFSQQPQNEGVGGMTVNTVGAIGYVDLGTALQAKDKIKMAWLENKAGEFIEPTPLNATLALAAATDVTTKPAFVPDPEGKDHYPIVGFTNIMVYRKYDDDKRLEALKALLLWCLTDGQNDCERLGYVRLAPNTAAEAIQMVKKLGS